MSFFMLLSIDLCLLKCFIIHYLNVLSSLPFRVMKNPINRQSINTKEDPRCPLSFRLGTTHSTHISSSHHSNVGAHTSPIIYPLHPDFDAGSGRQILLTTDYEVLEMWTPSNSVGTHNFDLKDADRSGLEGQSSEHLKEDEQFPLLFESSSFYHSSPIVHDVEGDGVADAILGDYDGNLYFVGLDFESPSYENGGANNHERRKRYYKHISIPRLFVRKSWYKVAINKTKEDEDMALMDENEVAKKNHTKWEEFEPYHTYFAGISDTAWKGEVVMLLWSYGMLLLTIFVCFASTTLKVLMMKTL